MPSVAPRAVCWLLLLLGWAFIAALADDVVHAFVIGAVFLATTDLARVVIINEGGMTWHGVLVGSVLGGFFFAGLRIALQAIPWLGLAPACRPY